VILCFWVSGTFLTWSRFPWLYRMLELGLVGAELDEGNGEILRPAESCLSEDNKCHHHILAL
jgi:hypothetical protein